jgi:predicted acylesterase/phospholipase RssA/CRP-like cAMP-binding protein
LSIGQESGSPGPAQRHWRGELLELLRARPSLSALGEPTLAELVDAFEVLGVPGGTYLVRAGQQFDALYGVLNGALRLVLRSDDGVEKAIREFYRGEMLGFAGMFVEHPMPLDLVVLRDSTLVRLSRERFFALTRKQPELLQAVMRMMSEYVLDMLVAITGEEGASALTRGGNLGLIALSPDATTRETVQQLVDLVTAGGAVAHVNAERIDSVLGAGASDSADDGGRVTEWLSNLERASRSVVYESGPRQPVWAARSVRQSDRLLVVASSGNEARLDEIAAVLARATAGVLSRQVHLMLVHPEETDLPSGTRVWSRLAGVTRIHHVRKGHRRDLGRVLRHVMGRPVGVALSGGGARGIAHLGVLSAMVEADIPIDYICGTSMGSIFAACTAAGFSIEQMREAVRALFRSPFALYDPTLPVSSLLAGKKLDRVMRKLYADADIEDLWLPFFCVSTDLSRAMLVVHDRGSLWKSVRASCSIPGLFPPLAMGGRALADGGLMDNLPLDLLAERCPGSLIAVDVFPYGDPTFAQPAGRIQRWIRRARSAVRGEPASPPLFDILVRSTLVGSKFRQETAAARLPHVLYLEPPVGEFGILGWRAHRALFDAGYNYAKDRLREAPFVELARASDGVRPGG